MKHKFLVHTDVVSAYLHAPLDGDPIYITLPKGMNDPQGMVRQLYKALNGIDRAGQLWHNHYDNFIIQQGFERNSRDHCLCSNQKTGVDSTRYVYVDDILSACMHR